MFFGNYITSWQICHTSIGSVLLRSTSIELSCPTFAVDCMSELYDLYQQGICCDVTLSTGDYQTSAHKVVLMASSEYFKSLFLGSPDDFIVLPSGELFHCPLSCLQVSCFTCPLSCLLVSCFTCPLSCLLVSCFTCPLSCLLVGCFTCQFNHRTFLIRLLCSTVEFGGI